MFRFLQKVFYIYLFLSRYFVIDFLKLKVESCGRADSLQNANHCRPTVFVYIEVAFKCRSDIIRPQVTAEYFC